MTTIHGVTVVMPPPEGYVVDFEHPQRHYVLANYLVAGIGMFLAFLFLAQRIFVKITIQRSFGIDDYLCVVSWMFTVAMQGLVIHGFVDGLYGIHAWEMPIEKFGEYVLLANYVQAIVYVFPTLLSKVCLLVFYIKLQNRELWYKLAVWITMVVTVGSNLGILFSVAFACNPPAMAYDITVTDGTCINRSAVFKATAAFGIITDILIFLIPIPMVYSLRLSRRNKMGLIAVFVIGSATVITSIIRLILLMQNLSKADLTWIGGPIFMWICIEANLLVICACIPTLKVFLKNMAPKIMGYTSSQQTSKYGPNSSSYGNRSRGGLPTISSSGRPKPNRDNYYGFDDDEEDNTGYRMQTLVEGGGHKSSKTASSARELGVTGTSNEAGDRDGDSEKAIITKTVQISYDDRHV